MWFSHLSIMDLSKGFRHSESQNDLGLVMLYKSSVSFPTLVLETLRQCHIGYIHVQFSENCVGML